MSELINELYCPALGREIDIGYCQELQMATDDEIIWDGMEDLFDQGQMKTCKGCPKRIDPAAV